MPTPGISKIALHFTRVAANNAAAGIRSALYAGNSAAASAGINAGGATAAAAGGAGLGLGAAAASAGAGAGASAAGGKTWGAYTYYQNAGHRTLANLNPGSGENSTTRTDDDDDEPQQLTPAQEALQQNKLKRAPRISPSSTSSTDAPQAVGRVARSGSVAQVGLRAYPRPALFLRSDAALEVASASKPASIPSHLLATPRHSAARLQAASFTTAAISSNFDGSSAPSQQTQDQHLDATPNAAVDPGQRPSPTTFRPKRLRSYSVSDLADTATSEASPSADETADGRGSETRRRNGGLQRRNSYSSRGPPKYEGDVDRGLQSHGATENKRIRHNATHESSSSTSSLHNRLHARLRGLAFWSGRRHGESRAGAGAEARSHLKRPPPHLVRSVVQQYLTEVPAAEQSVSGWNACLEALYAARCLMDITAHVSQDAATSVVGTGGSEEALGAVASAAQEGGETAAVQQVEAISDASEAAADTQPLTVLSVYSKMLEAGFQATGRTYGAVIQALVRQNLILTSMLKSGLPLPADLNEASTDDDETSLDNVETSLDAEDQDKAVASFDNLLWRALELLNTAVSAHPRKMTHPVSTTTYGMLLSVFARRGLADDAETVLSLYRRSAEEARYFKTEMWAYLRVIHAHYHAVPEGARASEEERSEAVDGMVRVLDALEADVAAGLFDSPVQESAFAPGLRVYNMAMQHAFELKLPDRAIEIFERLIRLLDKTGKGAPRSVSETTMLVLFQGFVSTGEPQAAMAWLQKLQELNKIPAPGDEDQPFTYEVALIQLTKTIVDSLNERKGQPNEQRSVAPYMETLAEATKEMYKIEVEGSFEPRVRTILFKAKHILRQSTMSQTKEVLRKETIKHQPWTQGSALLPLSSPPGLATSIPGSPQQDAKHILTPPASPAPDAESKILHKLDANAAPFVAASSSSPEAAPEQPPTSEFDLPPVAVVDVDLGADVHFMLKPKRVAGHQVIVNVEGALAKVLQNIAVGTYPTPESVGTLMMSFGRQGDLARVRHLYAIASAAVGGLGGNPRWQADAWHRLEDQSLCALAHAGEMNAAIACRHRIIAAGRVPSADAYAALIATVKDTTDDALVAEELFDESQRLGTVPNAYLFTTVISKLSRARKATRALQLFEEMRAFNIRPTTVTYGAVINACARSGDSEGALRYYAEMEADPAFKARVPPFNCMIQLFTYTVPNRERALEFYNALIGHGVYPSSHTYKLLLDVHGAIEPPQPEEMEKVFDALRADPRIQVQGTHWASLIQCYGSRLQNLDKATEVWKTSLASSGPDPIAFEALLTAFFDAKRPDLIRQHVDSMQGSGLRMTAYVCNVYIKGLALEGTSAGLEEARRVFEQMQDPPTGLAATGNHAARLHGAGAVPQVDAASPSPASEDPASQLGQVYKEPSTYESMIRAELAHGHVEAAEALLARMESRAFPPALILRTRSLLDVPADRTLTADLVSGAAAASGEEAVGGSSATEGTEPGSSPRDAPARSTRLREAG